MIWRMPGMILKKFMILEDNDDLEDDQDVHVNVEENI